MPRKGLPLKYKMLLIFLRVECWLFACSTSLCISYKLEILLFSVRRVERKSKGGDDKINNFESGCFVDSASATLLFLPGLYEII